jgi:hypothetical protein
MKPGGCRRNGRDFGCPVEAPEKGFEAVAARLADDLVRRADPVTAPSFMKKPTRLHAPAARSSRGSHHFGVLGRQGVRMTAGSARLVQAGMPGSPRRTPRGVTANVRASGEVPLSTPDTGSQSIGRVGEAGPARNVSEKKR